jgi:serine protease Do
MAIAEEVVSESTLADELAVTAALVQRSTVQVRTRGPGAGSGVVWRHDGLIITNNHVAHGPVGTIELWDGRTFDAEVISRDPGRDLAALRVNATDLPTATIADSDALRVGQLVAAVGNPLGLSGALTLGIIHAIAPAEGHGARTWVQADIRLAPGNSGGPLVDVEGRVIGINSMIAGGLGLAVPSNAVQRFLGERSQGPRLGVTMQPVLVPLNGRRSSGLLVLDVASGSPADAGGLLVGDILVGMGGRLFNAPNDLFDTLQSTGSGVTVRLHLVRGGVPTIREVVLRGDEDVGRAENDTGAAA